MLYNALCYLTPNQVREIFLVTMPGRKLKLRNYLYFLVKFAFLISSYFLTFLAVLVFVTKCVWAKCTIFITYFQGNKEAASQK